MASPVSIYASGVLYTNAAASVADLKSSGFTTVIAWALHVKPNGDLNFNDTPIVQGGEYVGDTNWSTELAALKQGTTNVTQFGFSIGGWEVGDFNNIKNLVNDPDQGTGPDSALYKSFQALTKEIAIDFIDLDDETTYDHDSTVAFCQMLYNDFNLNITFCPYNYGKISYWTGCYVTLNDAAPGTVLGMNLQCYAGGTGNDPGTWIAALNEATGLTTGADVVWPSLWCLHSEDCDQGNPPTDTSEYSDGMEEQFSSWQAADAIVGGFVWLYDDIVHCQESTGYSASDYASALLNGIG